MNKSQNCAQNSYIAVIVVSIMKMVGKWASSVVSSCIQLSSG